MLTNEEMKLVSKQLQEPFPAEDIEWRVQQSGFDRNGNPYAMIMPYVTSRAIQQRLDDVVGAGNWMNDLREVKTDRGLAFICGIEINIDGRWVTKEDGADETNFENFKGGISNAMKRAGVQWGIGRYLYKLDVKFADLREDRSGHFKCKITDKDNKNPRWFSYDFPTLPSWALPNGVSNPEPTQKDDHEKAVEQIGGRNLTEEAQNCSTLQELATWYKNLPSEMKKTGSPAVAVKNDRKAELSTQKEPETKPEPEQKKAEYTFDELKTMTVKDLKTLAGKKNITGAGKMKKSDLINNILKEING